MLVPVQTVAEEGPEVFSIRDEKGHTPAHWVCLAGNPTILRFIMDNKGPVDEPSENELAAHPIHWACVNGHINIVDILLQYGVSIDITDNKGCTPLIVAAQYGHTMLAGYLMGKGARLQMVDKDGDNALHWASFKGLFTSCWIYRVLANAPRRVPDASKSAGTHCLSKWCIPRTRPNYPRMQL